MLQEAKQDMQERIQGAGNHVLPDEEQCWLLHLGFSLLRYQNVLQYQQSAVTAFWHLRRDGHRGSFSLG